MTGVELIGALASDYLAASGFALSSVGGFAAGNLLEALFRKRAEAARAILVEEMRHGTRAEYDIDEDEAAAVVFRFFRAATEGAARLNLGLMGSCIAEGASADRLRADLFMRWAEILAGLRREEVHLLASCKQVSIDHPGIETPWGEVRKLMSAKFGYADHEVDAFAAALARTGCLVPAVTAWTTMNYKTTTLFNELSSLVDVDGVIQRHDGK